jgi:hypothetical protein
MRRSLSIPEHYLYLVDADTQQPVAIFSSDDCHGFRQSNAREAQIRARYHVDDTDSGLLLRSGFTAPLPAEKIVAVLRDMKRRGVSSTWSV